LDAVTLARYWKAVGANGIPRVVDVAVVEEITVE